MDGGGRLLRSLGALGAPLAPAPFVLGGPHDLFAASARVTPRLPPRLARRQRSLRKGLVHLACSRALGAALGLGLLVGATGYGLVKGGRYAAFTAAQGTLPDFAARAAGFAIKAVTITGAHTLGEPEVLSLAGIGPHNSLVFMDAAAIRARLKAVPLIKDASVTKLYPDRLMIEIEERQPAALWQKDGALSIVAADGTSIDEMKDPRYERLPLVVGEGANRRIDDYLGILDASRDLRERVRAGIFVAGRRWTLKMDNGVDVDLPENHPAEAVARLAALEHDGRILEKDVVALDLRIQNRVIARVSADAAASRADALARKAKKKGATP